MKNLKINIKKIKAIMKLGVSIALVPTIGSVITIVDGWNPFKLNTKEKTSITIIDIDEKGNIEENKSYSPKDTNYIKYYTKWEQENNKYKREKYTYIITEEDIDKITTIIKEKPDNEKIEKELNREIKKITKEYEYKTRLTEEEKKETYIKAKINKINEKEIVTESLSEHISIEIAKIMIELLWMSLEFKILKERKFFKNIKEELNIKTKKYKQGK